MDLGPVAAIMADLAAVLDLATRKVVGWSMRDHMRAELPLAALMMAAQRQRPAEGLICHSDQGSQYASETYGKQLLAMKAEPSMSRTACCYDNAPMETFFHTLKVERVHQTGRPSLADPVLGGLNGRFEMLCSQKGSALDSAGDAAACGAVAGVLPGGSGRMPMEPIDCNPLSRWFVGPPMDATV